MKSKLSKFAKLFKVRFNIQSQLLLNSLPVPGRSGQEAKAHDVFFFGLVL